jgi:hypothetical protein
MSAPIPGGLQTILDRTRALRSLAAAERIAPDAIAFGLALEAIDAMVATFGAEATRTFLISQEAALRGKVQVPGLTGTA